MQHNLDRIALRVMLVALAPVVTNGIGKDATRLVKRRRRDAAPHIRISLETVLGVLVPEVERAVRSSRAKGAMDGVERNIVDSVDVDDVVYRRISVTFEGEV